MIWSAYHCVHGTSCLYTWSASALIELSLCQLDFFLIRNLYMEIFVYTCMCMCDQKTLALHLVGNKPSPKPVYCLLLRFINYVAKDVIDT